MFWFIRKKLSGSYLFYEKSQFCEIWVSRTCLGRSLSSSSAAVDRQDDVPGLLLRFDVPGRLDHVLQRVASIDDRPVSPGLDELLEEEDILLRVASYPER